MTYALVIAATFLVTTLVWLALLNLSLGDKQIDALVESAYSIDSPQFARMMGALLGPPIVGGNRVQALLNGDEIFPAMLEAIRGARHSITFETYIYWSGTIGREFADALIARAHSGVRIHVMLDWWGSDGFAKLHLGNMTAAGIEVRLYNRLRLTALGRMNNRTHRKLLVVDGSVGFIGGVGIADSWRGHAQDSEHWRDTHFRVVGPAVAQMQAAFVDNWIAVTGRPLDGPAYLPPIEADGPHAAQVFTSAPGGGAESMQFMFLMSIAASRHTLRMSLAYFVPDNVAVETLVAARARGVRVQLIVPGAQADRRIVRWASRFEWGPLLRAGVEIHEYQATMYHCKVMIVDDLWTSVGSTNFDSRSFSVNDEANLNVLDAGFARAQAATFEHDLQASRRVTLAEWEGRPWTDKARDACAGLLSSQL
ncbi:MAG TPA: phospholipase D-like domain-containing protein [Burkholderiaceae bacterium]|nr:phospholipase D-like domain-containing protein [Burkholderiaceae bacterium]